MTILQREVNRKLHLFDADGQYNRNLGELDILYDGRRLCSLNEKDHILSAAAERDTPERDDMYQSIGNMITHTKEYVRLYENAQPFEIEGISDYRKLAEFNGVVLGAKDMGDYGVQFSTWLLTYGGTGVTLGHYTFDYELAKNDFAERSGLVDKHRQFTNEQLADIYRCVAFSKDTVDSLSYEQDKALDELMDKIGCVLPEITDDPQFELFPSEDDGMAMQ